MPSASSTVTNPRSSELEVVTLFTRPLAAITELRAANFASKPVSLSSKVTGVLITGSPSVFTSRIVTLDTATGVAIGAVTC